MSDFLSLKDQMSRDTDSVFSRVWDDACDVGFKIKSTRTGVEKLFVFVRDMFHDSGNDHEFVGTVFKSEDGFTAVILND